MKLSLELLNTVEQVVPSSRAPRSNAPLSLVPPASDASRTSDDYSDSVPPTVRSEREPETLPTEHISEVISSVPTPSAAVYGTASYWRQLARQVSFGGFTIRLNDGQRPVTGYAVGFMVASRTLIIPQPLCLSPDLVAKVLEGYRDMLLTYWENVSDAQCLVGWVNDAGDLVIEAIVNVSELGEALSLATMTEQKAIYNLATGETIYL